jgi:hypothetical protein
VVPKSLRVDVGFLTRQFFHAFDAVHTHRARLICIHAAVAPCPLDGVRTALSAIT